MTIRNTDRKTKRTAYRSFKTGAARLLVSLLACTLMVCALPVDTFAYSESPDMMAEEIAVDLYGQGNWTSEAYDAREARPRLEASAVTFAEALVQDYRPVAGTVDITSDSRFYIVCGEDAVPQELADTVALAGSMFAAYGIAGDRPLAIAYGPLDKALESDIIIDLKNRNEFLAEITKHLEKAEPAEAYELDADERVWLSACTEDGIYQGLLTLMQICLEKKTDAGRITLNRFRISDAPDLRERTIFIDCARKYFSKEWLRNFIRRASLMRYNTIVLHFSEAEGLRFDSAVFPWLTEGLDSISRDEMKEIVETANMYHMNVIPSIDTPGHNRYMVSKYAEYVKKNPDFSFTYGGVTYDRNTTKGFGSIANHYARDGHTLKVTDIGIDITKEHAVAFSNALIDDYADFFRSLGCTDFDICGDEIMGWSNFMLGDNEVSYDNRWLFLEHWSKYARKVLGIGKGSSSDAFISYLNSVTERLESKGYTCRVFNDEIDINKNQHVDLRESVAVTCWDLTNNSAKHFAEKGHTVYNGVMQWTYYVVRKIGGKDIMKGRYKTVNAENIYKNWDPRSFSSKKKAEAYVADDKFGGGYFFIWCDAPNYKDSVRIWIETEMRMWANSTRMWNPEVNSVDSGIRAAMTYDMLEAYAGMLGSFPGNAGDPGAPANLPDPATPQGEKTLWEKSLGDLEL